jgi:hypothetical protein
VKGIDQIYNTYLRISRSKKNLPFKLRKDFSNIQNEEKYPVLLKLENFFKRNPYVNLNDFFEAPYNVYEDEKDFGLEFYLSQKAVKIYNLYQKKKTFSDPDSDIQRKAVLNGLEFIYGFCKLKKITIDDYINHMTNGMATVFIHLKEKQISIYNCLAFDDFQKTINKHNYELLDFMLGDTISKISIFRTKYYSSKKCMNISKQGLKILKEKLANLKISVNMASEL